MKKFFLTFCGFTAALMFAACGGDSSSNSVDREDDSSSSVEEDSTDVSSSSAEYKDPSWPEGARAATLDDMKKYHLVKIDGETFRLSTGSKEGMFSLWAIDENKGDTHLALLLVTTDFENGIVEIDSSNTMDPFVLDEKYSSNKVLKSIRTSAKKRELSFVVVGDQLKYRVDKGDFADLEVETVDAVQSLMNKAENLDKKKLACNTSGSDTTLVFTFYNGRYIMERVVKGDTVSWNAGLFDIYRGYAFFLSKFATGADLAVMSRRITAKMDSIRDYASCKPSDFKYSAVEASSIKGNWAAFDEKANMDWKLSLKASMNYTLTATDGRNESKSGYWDVYGDQLLLKVQTMLDVDTRCEGNSCAFSIKGPVSDISEDGFTYKHSEKGTPSMPKEWGVPELDE